MRRRFSADQVMFQTLNGRRLTTGASCRPIQSGLPSIFINAISVGRTRLVSRSPRGQTIIISSVVMSMSRRPAGPPAPFGVITSVCIATTRVPENYFRDHLGQSGPFVEIRTSTLYESITHLSSNAN